MSRSKHRRQPNSFPRQWLHGTHLTNGVRDSIIENVRNAVYHARLETPPLKDYHAAFTLAKTLEEGVQKIKDRDNVVNSSAGGHFRDVRRALNSFIDELDNLIEAMEKEIILGAGGQHPRDFVPWGV